MGRTAAPAPRASRRSLFARAIFNYDLMEVARIPPKISRAPRPNVCGVPRVMKSSDDDCRRLAGECSRWAEEAQDRATREAFRQMAKVWSQLAFGHFKPPAKAAGETVSLPAK